MTSRNKKPCAEQPEFDALHARAAAEHIAAHPDTQFTEKYRALGALGAQYNQIPEFLQ